MDIGKAKEILKDDIKDDGGLYCLGRYLSWNPGENSVCLDCMFDVEELEAIVCYIKHFKTTVE